MLEEEKTGTAGIGGGCGMVMEGGEDKAATHKRGSILPHRYLEGLRMDPVMYIVTPEAPWTARTFTTTQYWTRTKEKKLYQKFLSCS